MEHCFFSIQSWIESAAKELPAEVVTAAKKRGQERDLRETAAALLV